MTTAGTESFVTLTGAETLSAIELSQIRSTRRWVIPAISAIVIVAALLYTWNIGFSGLSTFYAAGAKSMSESWRALFFGALNPSATTTLDKLSGFLVPQAISARLFGFSAWALSLPQAVEGVVTIVTAYVIGARWRGPIFGVALAFLAAFTPMLAAMFGHPMEDGMLTMCTVLAFAAAQRAVLRGRFAWLMVSMVWVAIGFQAKMMQAWLVLPAIAVMWYLGTEASRRTRILQLGAAAVTVLALSVSWMTAIQLVPAASRPFVDGTTNNNMFSMVFGYNGLNRIIPGLVPGAIAQLHNSSAAVVNSTATSDAGHSVFKLLMTEFTTQIGWLLPLALVGIILIALGVFGHHRSRAQRIQAAKANSVAIGFTLWLIIPAAVLSVAFVPHATYFAQIAIPLATLALAGTARVVRAYREGMGRQWLALPILVAVETLWTLSIILRAPAALRLLAPPVAILGVVAVVLLVLPKFRMPRAAVNSRRMFLAAVGAATVAALLGPIVWSSAVVGPGGGGSASDAYAGPRSGAFSPAVAARRLAESQQKSLRRPFTAPPMPKLDSQQSLLLNYITPRNGGRSWLFASDSMPISVSFLLYTRDDVIPMGGFSRAAPDPRGARVRNLIASGALRYVLLNGTAVAAAATQPDVTEMRRWVKHNCTPVFRGKFRQGTKDHQELYDCSAAG